MFGYNWKYLLTHPWVLIGAISQEIKFAWQRVFRGWDDKAVWDIDHYLANLISQLVKELKELERGVPTEMFEEEDWDEKNFCYKDGAMEKAVAKWELILDEIADGFIYYRENIYDSFTNEEIEELQRRLDNSIDLMKKHYMSLWW